MAKIILVTGGARSGKSARAEAVVASSPTAVSIRRYSGLPVAPKRIGRAPARRAAASRTG